MTNVVTLGAAYSANKGAASMVQALVENLPQFVGPVHFVAVSTHPDQDRASYKRAGLKVEVAAQRPVEMVAWQLPLAAVAGLLRVVGVPWRWLCRSAALKALAGADVVADLSGISFADGRRTPILVYNALLVLLPLLLGRRIVKCSQAMGPFHTVVNRRLAAMVLPRLHTICPRGEETQRNLEALGLSNLKPAADLAFAMGVEDSVRRDISARLEAAAAGRPYVVVSPSQVVDTSCKRKRIDYPAIMADLIDSIVAETPCAVVLIAHSAQPNAGINHMNDLPLCRTIHRRLQSREKVVFMDDDLLPAELRAVIAGGALLVTSRFHAMISALAETTPLVVIGWSHKYAEVLETFDLGEVAIPFEQLPSGAALARQAQEIIEDRDKQIESMRRHRPAAAASAHDNFRALVAALGKEEAPVG